MSRRDIPTKASDHTPIASPTACADRPYSDRLRRRPNSAAQPAKIPAALGSGTTSSVPEPTNTGLVNWAPEAGDPQIPGAANVRPPSKDNAATVSGVPVNASSTMGDPVARRSRPESLM